MCSPPSSGSEQALPGRQLGPGYPTSPATNRLGLLPSGPDPLHGATPRGTQSVNTACLALDLAHYHPQAGIRPRIKRTSGTGRH